MSIERLKRFTRFYLVAIWSIYINIGLVLFGMLLMGSPLGFYMIYGAGFLAIVVLPFAIALMVVALVVFVQLPKRMTEFTKSAKIGGWSAAVFAVASALTTVFATGSGGVLGPFVLIVAFVNPLTLGLALLVIHHVIMRRAKAMLVS